ncbi:MAG: hypothetical protein HY879_12570 [Deltaproteobacteria bacterium]|nr:hypothetical protein [Deltaproteobacteria bacterium]
MTKSDDRMLWIRNLEGNNALEEFDTVNAEIGSESRITGLLDYDDGAILFGPTTHSPDSTGLFKYILRVRLGSESTSITHGKRKGYLFREGQIGELIAIASLCLQARFYVLSTTVGRLTSHGVPIKSEFSPPRIAFGHNIDPVIFSANDRNLAIELPVFLKEIRLIPPKHHLSVALAANHYARALREIGIDEEMVFVRLVAAVETAAHNQSISNDPLLNKRAEDLFRLDKLTASEIQGLKNLLETRRAKARFVAFLERFSPGFFEGMPEKPAHTQITPATLSSVAGAIYDARSGYLHNGYPMYLSHYSPAFPEWHMDPSVGMTWQSRSYTADQKLPRADFFHRLVRHCLLSYFKSLVLDPNEINEEDVTSGKV